MKIHMEDGHTMKGTFGDMICYTQRNGKVYARSKGKTRDEVRVEDEAALFRLIKRARKSWATLSDSDRACWNAYADGVTRGADPEPGQLHEGLCFYTYSNFIRPALGLPKLKAIPGQAGVMDQVPIARSTETS